jgi:hypothetical protein
MCGPDGLVQWINPDFSAMCGYTLEELRGKKLVSCPRNTRYFVAIKMGRRQGVRREHI